MFQLIQDNTTEIKTHQPRRFFIDIETSKPEEVELAEQFIAGLNHLRGLVKSRLQMALRNAAEPVT